MTAPSHLETREILHPAVLVVSGYNANTSVVGSSGDDDRVSQGDAASIPVIKILHLILLGLR